MNKGMGKLVRNGKDTLFWIDHWLVNYVLQDLATGPIPSSMLTKNRLKIIGKRRMDGDGQRSAHFFHPPRYLR